MKLVRTLISVKGMNQAEVAKKADVSRNALVSFLADASDLRSKSLLKVLLVLGADLEELLKREISKSIGTEGGDTVGEDIVFLLENVDAITRKTTLETLIASFNGNSSSEIRMRLERIKDFRDSIKTVGRGT